MNIQSFKCRFLAMVSYYTRVARRKIKLQKCLQNFKQFKEKKIYRKECLRPLWNSLFLLYISKREILGGRFMCIFIVLLLSL